MGEPTLPEREVSRMILQNLKPPRLGNEGPALNDSILRALRIMDEQDAINSGEWFGMPYGLNANLVERILYYRHAAMFFYLRENNQFYCLPYVGEGLDVYGRSVYASPLAFNGHAESTTDKRKNGKKSDAEYWMPGKKWRIQYDIVPPGELKKDDFIGKCVILTDYSRQISQKGISRQALQEPLLQVEAEIIPFMRTSLLNNSGIDGVRVQNQDEGYSVEQASNALVRAALVGDRWIPIEAGLTLQALSHGSQGRIEDYLLTLQALDNLRLSMHGLDAGGLFQKKAHMLQSEQQQQSSSASLVEADRTYQRQEFCNIVNSIWGLGMWYEPSEIVKNFDRDGDGELENRQDMTAGQSSFEESYANEEGGEE